MESTGPLLGAPLMAELKNAAYADGNVICQLDHNNHKQGNGGQKIQFLYIPPKENIYQLWPIQLENHLTVEKLKNGVPGKT